jgi:uncharacterized protein (TIGR03435 family)
MKQVSGWVAALMTVLSPYMLDQANSGQLPSFEVASVRPNRSMARPLGMTTTPGRLRARNYTLKALIEEACGVKPFQVRGAAGWIATERYDIDAKADSGVGRKQLMLMLRTLLSDRFQLKMHREVKQLPVYRLVLGKGGPQLKPSNDRDNTPASLQIRPNAFIGHKVSMRWFTDALSAQVNRPVLDGTGLKGDYDFDIQYAPQDGKPDNVSDNSTEPDDEDDNNVTGTAPISTVPMFTAIREQLGMKVLTQKGPVEILIIDHAAKPSPN